MKRDIVIFKTGLDIFLTENIAQLKLFAGVNGLFLES